MATKYGTAKGETITGTSSADTVYARAGDDTLLGRAGGDRLLGEAGNDKVYGEDGNDTLTGGFGDDLLDGGAGRDRILYTGISAPDADGYGVNVDLGNPEEGGFAYTSTVGHDTLHRIEDVDGSRFDDVIVGSSDAANRLDGGAGNDLLDGRNGADTVYGGADNDSVYGDDYRTSSGPGSADQVYGGDGSDHLYGGMSNDTLRGEAGNDHLNGNTDSDTLIGGGGADSFTFYANSLDPAGRDIVADFVKGQDELAFTGDFDSRSIEGFDALDTNNNNVLDNGDEHVDVAGASYGGASRTSTIVDVSAEAGSTAQFVVFGVTGLTAGDFV